MFGAARRWLLRRNQHIGSASVAARAFLGTFACELAEMGGEAFSVRKAFNARGRVERAVIWEEPWGTHGRRANGRPTSWAFEVATQLCAHVLQDIAFPFN